MKKNRIKLTESQLHRVIKESVNKILRESNEPCNKLMYSSENDKEWYDFESLTHSYSENFNFHIESRHGENEEYTDFSSLLSELGEGATDIEIYRNNSRTEFHIIIDNTLHYYVYSDEPVNR